MVEVTTLDLVIIGLYLLFMLLVGVWFVKRIKNTDDYYVAGRTLGPVVLAATVCATIIGGSAMMGRAGIAYTTGFMAIATALPYMLGMFIFSGYAGRIQQVGRSTTSSPSPACSSTASESRLNASWLLWWLSPWWARWPPRSPPPLPLLSCWGTGGHQLRDGGFYRHRHLHHLYRRLRTVRRGVHRCGAVFHAHYLCLPDDPIFQSGLSGGFGSFWASLDKSYITPAIDGKILGTSSPIWCSPWRGRRCGSGPSRPRIKSRPSGACSGAPPSMA